MREVPPARIRVVHTPEIGADVLVVACEPDGHRLIGRQPGGKGRVVRADEPFEPQFGRHIEIYSSSTDLGRARLKRLSAPLREFLELTMRPHPDVDVENVDEVPLDIDGYV